MDEKQDLKKLQVVADETCESLKGDLYVSVCTRKIYGQEVSVLAVADDDCYYNEFIAKLNEGKEDADMYVPVSLARKGCVKDAEAELFDAGCAGSFGFDAFDIAVYYYAKFKKLDGIHIWYKGVNICGLKSIYDYDNRQVEVDELLKNSLYNEIAENGITDKVNNISNLIDAVRGLKNYEERVVFNDDTFNFMVSNNQPSSHYYLNTEDVLGCTLEVVFIKQSDLDTICEH